MQNTGTRTHCTLLVRACVCVCARRQEFADLAGIVCDEHTRLHMIIFAVNKFAELLHGRSVGSGSGSLSSRSSLSVFLFRFLIPVLEEGFRVGVCEWIKGIRKSVVTCVRGAG